MLATLAAALWLLISTPQTYAWEPASGPVAGYEVELGWTLLRGDEETLERRQVAEPKLVVEPRLNHSVRLRARARNAEGVAGEWSEWSERVGTRSNPDLTGDGVVGVPDYMLIGGCHGGRVSADGRAVEC